MSYLAAKPKTTKQSNAMNLEPPFILQVGDERVEIKERGRLEFSEDLTELVDDDDILAPPILLRSTQQEVKFWIGERLAFTGGGWGVKEFGRYVKPDNGLPEIHLDPQIVRAVS